MPAGKANKPNRFPNFFIVGAPKCGTSSLFRYLSDHPEIFVPDRKELNYFCTDLTFRHYKIAHRDSSLDSYLALFSGWTSELRAGEASPMYLYSRVAAKKIHAISPDASIIIMVRNPVDLVYSLYYQLLETGDEDIDNFEDALNAEEDRRKGLRIPRTDAASGPVEALRYTAIASFSGQIQRYVDIFGRDNVMVLVYDDFAAATRSEYENVLRFLGVAVDHVPELVTYNPNRVIANKLLWRIRSFGPPAMRAAWMKALPPGIRRAVLRGLGNLSLRESPRPPMRPETREALQSLFEPEVEWLSRFLNRDLMYWVRRP
jgi:hypothetical protein